MTDLPTGHNRNSEIADQLRSLGEAAQSAVAPVTADEVQGGVPASSTTDIGLAPSPSASVASAPQGSAPQRSAPQRSVPQRSVPQRSGRVLAVAASVIVLAAAAFMLTRSDDTPAELDTATASQDDGSSDDPNYIYDDEGWAKLRFCESTDTYDTDTGNTFYGAYQFTRASWRVTAESIGLDVYADSNPAHAPPAVQDAVANAIYLDKGAETWPVCGRFVSGPMNSPVIPELLVDPDQSEPALFVFVRPEATQSEIDSIRADIEAGLNASDRASIEYVNQEDAYAEFLTRSFGPATDTSIRESVDPALMPSSFRLPKGVLDRFGPDALEDNPAVFQVVDRSPYLRQSVHRLVIPTLGVDVAIGETPTLDVLQDGVALQLTARLTNVIVGRAAGGDAPFRDLSQLRTGDRVELHTIVDEQRGGVFIQHLEVRLRSDVIAAKPLASIDDDHFVDSLNWRGANGIILVANDADDPRARLVVRLNPVVLDGETYQGSD